MACPKSLKVSKENLTQIQSKLHMSFKVGVCSGIVHVSKPNRLFVAILVVTLQCAFIEEIHINYFFRFYLFVINKIEIIFKDLDLKGLLRDIKKAQSL